MTQLHRRRLLAATSLALGAVLALPAEAQTSAPPAAPTAVKPAIPGDGGFVAIDPADTDVLYASTPAAQPAAQRLGED